MSGIGRHLTDEMRAALHRALIENPDIPATVIGAKLGISSTTVQAARRKLTADGIQTVEELEARATPNPDIKIPTERPTPAHERRIVQLEDELRRAKARIRELHRQSLDEDAMMEILGVLSRGDVDPPKWLRRVPATVDTALGEVPVLTWSDWHLGEVVSREETNGVNEFNLEIARKRIRRLVDNTLHLCSHHVARKYEGAVLNLLGDFCSGGIHSELAKTDELEILPTILEARDLLLWGVRQIADAFGKVYVPCVAGNHGRMTQRPEFKRYSYKNADWVIYKLLQRDLADDPRVTVDVRPSNEVDYAVYGLRIKIVHGDMLGVKGGDGIIGSIGPIVRGEVKLRGQSSTIGQDFDLLVMGHWHQQLWLPRVMVSNCLKGFDEYARLQLRASPTPPTQPLFFVNQSRGITSRWDVHVEDPKKPDVNWVSWGEQPPAEKQT